VTEEESRDVIERSGFFDPDIYRKLNPDIAALADPLAHYVLRGGFERRRAHRLFDPNWYVGRYGDVAKSGLHPLVHYLIVGRTQGRSATPEPRVFEVAKRMAAEARAIEQDVLVNARLSEPEFLPVARSGLGGSGLRAWQAIFDALPHAFDYIVFAPWLVRGGADVTVVNIVKAAIESCGPGSTLLVLPDYAVVQARDWLPSGIRVLCFSHFEPSLTHAERVQLVVSLVYAMRPKALINVNSAACWDAIATKGGALSHITRLFACLFCSDYAPDGRPSGYADTHLRDTIPYLTGVYSDNATFVRELTERYGIPSRWRSKFAVFYQPPLSQPSVTYERGPHRGRNVLWAGRFCRQKNVELLVQIAKGLPQFQFNVFGYGDEAHTNMLKQASKTLTNLTLQGAYSSFDLLPVNDHNVFLYTSLWDGLPNTLIEAGCIGIPVVASGTGGIPELITEDTGWLVRRASDPNAYTSALREACDKPGTALARASWLRRLVQAKHTPQGFRAALRESPSFLD
jgi:glycosyltransferase involved in cell wall biosynthesis